MGDKPEDINSKISATFKNDIVKEALRGQFTNPKNKITDESVELVGEILKTLAVEASLRAIKQATQEEKTKITLDHVEIILPQLLLDFP